MALNRECDPNQDLGVRNRLLLALSAEARTFILEDSVLKRLDVGQVLYSDGEPFTHAIFPHDGLIAIMAAMSDGRTVEKASLGYDSFVGMGLVMGGGGAMSDSVVIVPGYASWVPVDSLDKAFERFPCVKAVMLTYAKCFIVQLLETVACNSLHSARQRISRWLAHANVRIRGETFPVTQQALSSALGLRRATVNQVCAELGQAGALAQSRGSLTIRDAAVLEQQACECYGRIRLNFDTQFSRVESRAQWPPG